MKNAEKLRIFYRLIGELAEKTKSVHGAYAEGYQNAVVYVIEMMELSFPEVLTEDKG